MQDDGNIISRPRDRRSFLKTGLAATGAATVGTALLARATAASAQAGPLTAGDAAMLQFLAAGEAIEADFYTQYNELGGIQDSEVPGGTGNREYTKRLDANRSQLLSIHSRHRRRRDQPSELPECISGRERGRSR